VTVVTDGLSVKVDRGDKKVTVTLTLAESKDDKGRLIVPSADKLGLVRLDTNEVAAVRITGANSDLLQPLREAFRGEVEMVVVYEVSEAWAKRFGVTAVQLQAVATVKK
jgi:hypothetical protein